jgi:flagellar protein FlbD
MLMRLSGQPMAVNPDLIEKAEATPDTVITMVDGHKLVVSDSVPELVEKVRAWRASVAAEAFALSSPLPVQRLPRDRTGHDRAVHERIDHDDEPAGQAAQAAAGSPMGRVLRLPAREE